VQKLVDSTGAGDAFVGGFLAEWKARTCSNRGENHAEAATGTTDSHNRLDGLQEALVAGCLAGACAVQVVGGSRTLPLHAMREFRHKAPPASQQV
jgi:sugar/nucleoside kinase (ribokinase family)